MKSRVKPAMATRARRTLGRSQRGLLERHRAVEQKEPTKSWANIANETGRFDLAAPLAAPHVLPECTPSLLDVLHSLQADFKKFSFSTEWQLPSRDAAQS